MLLSTPNEADLLYPQRERKVCNILYCSGCLNKLATKYTKQTALSFGPPHIDCMANDLESDMGSGFGCRFLVAYYWDCGPLIVLGFVLAKFHHNLIENSLMTPGKKIPLYAFPLKLLKENIKYFQCNFVLGILTVLARFQGS